MIYSPENAVSPPFQFTIEGVKYLVGMFNIGNPDFPDVEQAVLARATNSGWALVQSKDPLWDDVKEDIMPSPDTYAERAIKTFNKKLAELHPDSTETYEQKVAAFFRQRLAMDGAQIVILDLVQ